jgi:tetratricopeptide (TPR) repeat protein
MLTEPRRSGKRFGVIEEMVATFLMAALLAAPAPLETARDHQDRPALEKQVAELSAAAQKTPHDAEAQYRVALAASYLAEVSLELHDKSQAEHVAETGIQAADRAIAINSKTAEYYRVLGTLCGQVVPASVLSAFSYGKRAREAIDKALELDPKSSQAYMARGVGNYYLPGALGGGVSLAIPDFNKASALDPSSAEAYLWLGLALRKQHHNAEARQAFEKALRLDPARIWIKQQLEKTPAQ